MVEEIGKIISKGFETFTKNLNLSIPFVLNFLAAQILQFLVFSVGFSYILGSELSSLENAIPERLVSILFPLIMRHIFEIAAMIILFILISLFIQSFFIAGAIGMAKQATETGKSEISTLFEYGKTNVVNLYLAEILVGLLFLAGVVFLVPGAAMTDLGDLLSSKNTGSILLLLGGFLLLGLYILILSIVLAIYSYALVIEHLGSIDGIITGLKFFNKHKFDVFLMWLIVAIISVVTILGFVFVGAIFALSFIWFIAIFVSVFVIAPLTTLWWVRLYMTRTGKKLYFNELLAHPLELEKLRANQ